MGYGLWDSVPLDGTIARERQPPGRLFFLLPTKERTKENCRCCDAADPRLRGCTPLRTPIRKSEGAGAKRTQYYCPFLTPPPLPPPLSRVFPRTPAGGRGRPPCQRVTPRCAGRCRGATEGPGPEGLAALAAWGIPTGLAPPPVPGQSPANLKGRAAALPCPSRPQPIHTAL